MAKSELPNKPGNYVLDGVTLYVFSDKIIVETGGDRKKGPSNRDQGAYASKKRKTKSAKNGGQDREKDENPLDALGGARDFVLGKRRKGSLF